jgi:hypothetical protein
VRLAKNKSTSSMSCRKIANIKVFFMSEDNKKVELDFAKIL